MDAAPAQPAATPHTASDKLLSAGFMGLLATQFLTALNDNILRWLVIGIGKDHVAAHIREHGSGGWLTEDNVLMAGTACLVLPYLIRAAPAG
jgi:acyl-[acyl-carrier-protein]-phospholipid O-acyltransferase/long-chain-fatty-acid--[acyl-carrier-protein] ligase